jgi:hypothetical protein
MENRIVKLALIRRGAAISKINTYLGATTPNDRVQRFRVNHMKCRVSLTTTIEPRPILGEINGAEAKVYATANDIHGTKFRVRCGKMVPSLFQETAVTAVVALGPLRAAGYGVLQPLEGILVTKAYSNEPENLLSMT